MLKLAKKLAVRLPGKHMCHFLEAKKWSIFRQPNKYLRVQSYNRFDFYRLRLLRNNSSLAISLLIKNQVNIAQIKTTEIIWITSVCELMAFKSVLLFVGLFVTVLAQSHVRLGNETIPLHYDVELTIDVSAKQFSVLTSISISVMEETTEITVNTNSLVPTTTWLASSHLISENGQVIQITSSIEDNDRLRLGFQNVIPSGNYVLGFDVKGSFGEGLVEVPLSLDDTSEL